MPIATGRGRPHARATISSSLRTTSGCNRTGPEGLAPCRTTTWSMRVQRVATPRSLARPPEERGNAMAATERRLGRGLGSLLSAEPEASGTTGVQTIPLDRIQANAAQPREIFDVTAME